MSVLKELLLGMLEDLWLFPLNSLHSCRCKKDFERARGMIRGCYSNLNGGLGIVVVVIHWRGDHEQTSTLQSTKDHLKYRRPNRWQSSADTCRSSDQVDEGLLEILVDLQAVVSRVGHHNVAVWRQTNALKAIIVKTLNVHTHATRSQTKRRVLKWLDTE